MNYVGEHPADRLRFDVYPDAEGRAAGSLYEDDGLTLGYLHGVARHTEVTYSASEIRLSAPTGSYQPPPRHFVFSLGGRTSEIADDGLAHRVPLRGL